VAQLLVVRRHSHSRQMSKRRTDDAEVQRIVHFVSYPSQETSLIEMSKTWSGADFLYALDRLQTDQPTDRRAPLLELYRRLRAEREEEDARRAFEEASAQRHAEISHRLDELKRPHWSIVPNFWMTVAILVFTVIGVIVAILAVHH
jgi:hypothetical protein